MIRFLLCICISLILFSKKSIAQHPNPFEIDESKPKVIKGMKLIWHDEFEVDGKPNTAYWKYENGFVRNQELQWYQPDNASCKGGVLIIEGRKEQVQNPTYIADSDNWKTNRASAEYTSASIQTRGLKQWQYGSVEVRARIDTTTGSWPAIWTLGASGEWPDNGEVDIMEFYRVKDVPTILANVAWGTSQKYIAKWDEKKVPLEYFTSKDTDWVKKFHIWRMDWTKQSIDLYLDEELINTTSLRETVNADGSNPFVKEQYLLLNLAIGGNGGKPANTTSSIRYEVDYVRIYQQAD